MIDLVSVKMEVHFRVDHLANSFEEAAVAVVVDEACNVVAVVVDYHRTQVEEFDHKHLVVVVVEGIDHKHHWKELVQEHPYYSQGSHHYYHYHHRVVVVVVDYSLVRIHHHHYKVRWIVEVLVEVLVAVEEVEVEEVSQPSDFN